MDIVHLSLNHIVKDQQKNFHVYLVILIVCTCSENEWAFDLLYCVAFVVMDKQWLERNATYMEFNVRIPAVFVVQYSIPLFSYISF